MGLREDLLSLSDPSPAALSVSRDPENADTLTPAADRGVEEPQSFGDDFAETDSRGPSALRGLDWLGPSYAGKRVSRKDLDLQNSSSPEDAESSVSEGEEDEKEESGSFSYELEPEGRPLDSEAVEDKMDRLFAGLDLPDASSDSGSDQADAVTSEDEDTSAFLESSDGTDQEDSENIHSADGLHAPISGEVHDDIQAAADLLEDQLTKQEHNFEQDVLEHVRTHEEQERQRGLALRDQRALWTAAMDVRISLQPVLESANRLPRGLDQKRAFTRGSDGKSVATSFARAERCAVQLLDELCSTQVSLASHRLSEHQVSDLERVSRKRPFEEQNDSSHLFSVVQEQGDIFWSFYRDTLDDWGKRLQRSDGSNKGFVGQTPLEQVDRIVADSDRLRKRARVSRMELAVFGEDGPAHKAGSVDGEVYDDLDWYQLLLKEVIETGPALRQNESVVSSKSSEWIRNEQLRRQLRNAQKSAKNVDRRASKGRKLRYDVNEKLVGFLAPRDPPILLAPAGLGGAMRAGATSVSGPEAAENAGDTVAQQWHSRQQPLSWHDVLRSSMFGRQ